MRRLALLTLATSLVAPALLAQSLPPRPKLAADADTNDARAYYKWGNQPDVDWKNTYDAYYWAQRLDPSDATYVGALYTAFLSRHPRKWQVEYEQGRGHAAKSEDAVLLDSMDTEWMLRDPYRGGGTTCLLVQGLEREYGAYGAGFLHYLLGCYRQANAAFAAALAKDASDLDAHFWRARGFYYQRAYDSTVSELNILLDSLRARDEKYLTHVYLSKAMFEYMIGFAEAHRLHWGPARAAYERALTEDLSFYIAHQRLAEAALKQSDVKTALLEYDLAVGLKPDNGALRNDYGRALYLAGHDAEAEVQLREAIRLEPYWAQPYYNLAAALGSQHKTDEAIAQYEAFLARCPRRLGSQAAEARTRLEKLHSTSGGDR
jgi:Tfp pilus assembly protein PilF